MKTQVTRYPKILKNDYVKAAVTIGLMAAIVLGFYFGLAVALGTSVPLRVVTSGSMCTAENGCDGWSCVFDQTLHRGDIIIIQSVKPEELNADYPNSDIIVFQKPNTRENPDETPVVHRIVEKYQVDGTWYFQTKGDGNGLNWPATADVSDYDSHGNLWSGGEGVPQDLVLGKVVMRIPYFGHITLIMQSSDFAVPLVVLLIVLLIVVQFFVPAVRARKKKRVEQKSKTIQP